MYGFTHLYYSKLSPQEIFKNTLSGFVISILETCFDEIKQVPIYALETLLKNNYHLLRKYKDCRLYWKPTDDENEKKDKVKLSLRTTLNKNEMFITQNELVSFDKERAIRYVEQSISAILQM